MAVAMDAMAVAIHIKYALNQNRYLIHTSIITSSHPNLSVQSIHPCIYKKNVNRITQKRLMIKSLRNFMQWLDITQAPVI